MNREEAFKIIEETFEKTTEEYKSMKWLKDKIEEANDDSMVIAYCMELYYLVINLLKKNKQLETKRDELKKWLEEEKKKHYDRKWLSDSKKIYDLEDNSAKTIIKVQIKIEELEGGSNV